MTAPAGTVIGPLTNGYAYDLKNSFSVRADPISGVDRVVFKLDGTRIQTDHEEPFAVAGDSGGTYTAWKPSVGSHVLVAIPYGDNAASGPAVTVSFEVIDSATPSPTPTPTSTPTPTPSPSSTPTSTPIPTPSPTPPDSTPSPTPTPTPAQPDALLNISTRLQVRTGDSVLIGGFIVTGEGKKDVVVRALGPSLAGVGVPKVLRNPELELYDSSGALLDQNSDWTTLPPGTVPVEFQPSDPLEAAIVASLPAGAYTAVLRGEDETIGVALCELYDLSQDASSVRNISTRGEVGMADDVMIGGFIIGGTSPKKVIVRAIGPSLAAFGVEGQLDNPEVELHDGAGSLVFSNDDWRSDQEKAIIESGLPPSDDRESVILATLAPGAYTAIVRGIDGATGVALIEIYALDP